MGLSHTEATGEEFKNVPELKKNQLICCNFKWGRICFCCMIKAESPFHWSLHNQSVRWSLWSEHVHSTFLFVFKWVPMWVWFSVCKLGTCPGWKTANIGSSNPYEPEYIRSGDGVFKTFFCHMNRRKFQLSNHYLKAGLSYLLPSLHFSNCGWFLFGMGLWWSGEQANTSNI